MRVTTEDAIRTLKSFMRTHPPVPGSPLKRSITMAVDALREQEKNRWIPVTERLPEKEGTYLIFTTVYFTPDHVDECDHYDGIEITAYSPGHRFFSKNGLFAKAWMPLPEPPKEEPHG